MIVAGPFFNFILAFIIALFVVTISGASLAIPTKTSGGAKAAGIPYGFGGVARPGHGLLPAEKIIRDHYYYGSSRVILSRAFCNANLVTDTDQIAETFRNGIKAIREVEQECMEQLSCPDKGQRFFEENHREVIRVVDSICGR